MKYLYITLISFLALGVLFALGSHRQVPPEVKAVELQDASLRGAGSDRYAPYEFKKYTRAYNKAKLNFNDELEKWVWLREYHTVADEFGEVLKKGERLRLTVESRMKTSAAAILKLLGQKKDRIDELRSLTLKMNEGRLARGFLMKAELSLLEARRHYEKGHYLESEQILQKVDIHLGHTQAILNNLLHRYKNNVQVAQWLKWIKETLDESKKKGSAVIIVDKIHRELTLYIKGNPVSTFQIGLGRNGLENKLYAGDNATPEGKYRVVKKIPASQYYKALLLDYPNHEDRKQFLFSQTKGLIPKAAGIGGLIEIHGGGKAFMTRGCVSMENDDMDEIFKYASEGMPVTIVGSVGAPNNILSSLAGQAKNSHESSHK